MTADEYRMLRRLRAARLTVQQIARKMGRHTKTISEAIRGMGLPTDLRYDPTAKLPTPNPEDAIAVRLFRLWADRSKSMADIARDLGWKYQKLYDASRKYGLPPRPRQVMQYRDEPDEMPAGEDEASAESLEFSPYVKARIKELRLGYHDKVTA